MNIFDRLLGPGSQNLPITGPVITEPSLRVGNRVVVMDNGFGIFPNAEEQIDLIDQSGYLFGPSLAATLNNVPSALHWWNEESKLLDGESQADCCCVIAHKLIPLLEQQREQEILEKKRKRQEDFDYKNSLNKNNTDNMETDNKTEIPNSNRSENSSLDNDSTSDTAQLLAESIVASVLRPNNTSERDEVNRSSAEESQDADRNIADFIATQRLMMNTDSTQQSSETVSFIANDNQPVNWEMTEGSATIDTQMAPQTATETIEQSVMNVATIQTENQTSNQSEIIREEETSAPVQSNTTPEETESSNVQTAETNQSASTDSANVYRNEDNEIIEILNNSVIENVQDNDMQLCISHVRTVEDTEFPQQEETENNENPRPTVDPVLDQITQITNDIIQSDLFPSQIQQITEPNASGSQGSSLNFLPSSESLFSSEENVQDNNEEIQDISCSSQVTVVPQPPAENTDPLLDIPEGVDRSFLEALPEDVRREVISEQRRLMRLQQRTQVTSVDSNTAGTTEVSPEFLAALPPALQEEVLAQQRLERQRQAAASVNPEDPVDTAAFFQNLQPSLRQAVSPFYFFFMYNVIF